MTNETKNNDSVKEQIDLLLQDSIVVPIKSELENLKDSLSDLEEGTDEVKKKIIRSKGELTELLDNTCDSLGDAIKSTQESISNSVYDVNKNLKAQQKENSNSFEELKGSINRAVEDSEQRNSHRAKIAIVLNIVSLVLSALSFCGVIALLIMFLKK